MLARVPQAVNANVLVGNSTSDDAGVYLLDDGRALVQTVDFFTPIIDDPFQFGRIAAANSLSDVYAMNGVPITALNILAFPEFELPLDMMAEILRGGADIAREAGVAILGGHSVDDREPKYGMSVTGLVDPKNIWRNVGARPGDALVVTKPIGVGVLATAIKKGLADDAVTAELVSVTTSLNARARDAAQGFDIHACTDITGFGLLGHLREMVGGSGVRATLIASAVPLMSGTLDFIAQGVVPGSTKRNRDFVADLVLYDEAVPADLRLALADSMTSGGLLFALPKGQSSELLKRLEAHGVPSPAVIGEIHQGTMAISVILR